MIHPRLKKFSVVIPCKNESASLQVLIPRLKELYSEAEVIIVNDGSTDNTSEICQNYNVIEVKHPYSKGNGAAIKSGAIISSNEVTVFLDGDGQHRPEDIGSLINTLVDGYDMVVGSRDARSQASLGRLAANKIYNRLAGWMVGNKIPDLTSGFRAVKTKKFREYIYLLPNGFSYPTTITMAFFRAGYSVGYINIKAEKRVGESHINIAKDGVRFLLIIFKVGTLYSPIKIFFPLSIGIFMSGVLYYAFTYASTGRFTNMGVLLFSTSLIIFLMGLISEQITTLLYSKSEKRY